MKEEKTINVRFVTKLMVEMPFCINILKKFMKEKGPTNVKLVVPNLTTKKSLKITI